MTIVPYVSQERRLPSRLSLLVDAMSHAVSRGTLPVLAALTCFYVVAVCLLSSLKLLWLDELITLFLVKSGSVAGIWRALKLGADPNPPLSYVCVLLSSRFLGEGAMALRLPAAVGYWAGLAGLFLYLRRRLPPVWALAGTFLSMAMAAFDYSYEARSYGLIYGLAMLSFLFWALATEPAVSRAKGAALIAGMTTALLLGICTNYFAVLALAPIAAGEIVRVVASQQTAQVNSRSLSLLVWAGLLIALSPLLLFRPLIARAIALYAPFAWNHVSLQRLADGYTEMVESTLFPLLATMLLAAVLLGLARVSQPRVTSGIRDFAMRFAVQKRLLPRHEAAAVITLTAYPILGYLAALLHGGMLSPRFVIPVCLGFAVGGVTVLCRMFASSHRCGLWLLCLCVAWFCSREWYVGHSYAQQRADFRRMEASVSEASLHAAPRAAIVVPDPLLAVSLEHYARPSLRQHLTFPIDFPAVRRYRHDDSPEENLWAGRALLPALHIVPLTDFQRQTSTYLIVAAEENWLLQSLKENHQQATRLALRVGTDNLGGFTPLAHGTPQIFMVHGNAETDPTAAGNKEPSNLGMTRTLKPALPPSHLEGRESMLHSTGRTTNDPQTR